MSCSYVREYVKAWCSQVGRAEMCRFYDTINQDQKPRDDVFFSIEFEAYDIEGTFCQDDYMEVGAVAVIVFARPGLGDDEAVKALERVVVALLNKTDDRLVFEGHSPINEDSGGSADRNYRVVSLLDYRHSSK
jgi:hypothetical protein